MPFAPFYTLIEENSVKWDNIKKIRNQYFFQGEHKKKPESVLKQKSAVLHQFVIFHPPKFPWN